MDLSDEDHGIEPLIKCRKRRDDVKTEEEPLPWDEFGSDLSTDRMAPGIKVARMWSGLLCGTSEPVAAIPRENPQAGENRCGAQGQTIPWKR